MNGMNDFELLEFKVSRRAFMGGSAGLAFGFTLGLSGQAEAQAAALLAKNKKPTREQIVSHMNGNLCRCGTYNGIVRAIQRPSKEV